MRSATATSHHPRCKRASSLDATLSILPAWCVCVLGYEMICFTVHCSVQGLMTGMRLVFLAMIKLAL